MKLRKIISAVTAAVMLMPVAAYAADAAVSYPFGTLTRQMETLDRGLVAMKTDGGIYLSWRLMSDEDTRFGSGTENVTFDIYRDGEKIGTEEDTTNFLDPDGAEESEYYVISSKGDQSKTVSTFESGSNYFDIPLNRPARSPYGQYTINDCSTGDLDGDGEYEIIVKWDANGKDNSQSGTTGEVLLDAYELDDEELLKRLQLEQRCIEDSIKTKNEYITACVEQTEKLN